MKSGGEALHSVSRAEPGNAVRHRPMPAPAALARS